MSSPHIATGILFTNSTIRLYHSPAFDSRHYRRIPTSIFTFISLFLLTYVNSFSTTTTTIARYSQSSMNNNRAALIATSSSSVLARRFGSTCSRRYHTPAIVVANNCFNLSHHYNPRRISYHHPITCRSRLFYSTSKTMLSSSSNDDLDSSKSLLTSTLATCLIEGKTSNTDTNNKHQNPMKACIAIAGGGSSAASSIVSTPGASAVLLESIVTYDRRSYAEFVEKNIVLENGSGNSDEQLVELEKIMKDGDDDEYFSFCSTQASILISKAALHRSIQLTTPDFTNQCLHCIGVSCTSSLVGRLSTSEDDSRHTESDEEKNTRIRRESRKSRAYIACSTLKDGTWVWEVELDNGSSRRSRLEEESVISNLILLMMLQYQEEGISKDSRPFKSDEFGDILIQILDRDRDDIAMKRINSTTNTGETTSAADGATQIINGDANVVAVLPVSSIQDDEQATQMQALFSDGNIPFPRDVLIVPGSFNPPHKGHVGLANAAVSALKRLRLQERQDDIKEEQTRPYYSRYSSLSSTKSSSSSSAILQRMWSTVDEYSDEQYDPTVFFEMSVTNADKPPLDPKEVERRVSMFTSSPTCNMPKDWSVILTNAPLFSHKTEILDNLIPSGDSSRKMSFVLGTDTFVRIINPKYYNNSRDEMIEALVDMRDKGVHFIVGGRLEQGTENNKPIFINGEEEVRSLPSDIQSMFTLLTEDEFRLDISSTELRKKMQE